MFIISVFKATRYKLQLIPSSSWFYPAACSSSASWIRLAADLYFNISSKFKDLFCKIHRFCGWFSTTWFQLPLIQALAATSRTLKKLEEDWRSLNKNICSSAQIKNICSSSFHVKETFRFHFVNETEIKKLIQGLNSKKATWIDTILPKLIKVAVNFFTPLLTKSINSSIDYDIFPDLAKTALVLPLDKGKPNKSDVANSRPVSILNVFSKIYESYEKPVTSMHGKCFLATNFCIS